MASPVRLIVFDMEGTLTADPTVWEIMHRKRGTWDSHGAPYWEQFKAGRMGYDEFARKDVASWAGAPESLLDQAVAEVPLMPGCRELLKFCWDNGIVVGIVSNGLERLGLRLAREFTLAGVIANREVVKEGRLTGELDIRVPFSGKADALRKVVEQTGFWTAATMAVGDGPADAEMFRAAGHSVAFMPDDHAVASCAKHVVTKPDLREIIPLLG